MVGDPFHVSDQMRGQHDRQAAGRDPVSQGGQELPAGQRVQRRHWLVQRRHPAFSPGSRQGRLPRWPPDGERGTVQRCSSAAGTRLRRRPSAVDPRRSRCGTSTINRRYSRMSSAKPISARNLGPGGAGRRAPARRRRSARPARTASVGSWSCRAARPTSADIRTLRHVIVHALGAVTRHHLHRFTSDRGSSDPPRRAACGVDPQQRLDRLIVKPHWRASAPSGTAQARPGMHTAGQHSRTNMPMAGTGLDRPPMSRSGSAFSTCSG